MKCLDTYALVGISDGNQKFTALLNEDVVITDLTMAEFYGVLFRKFNIRTADYWHRKLAFFCRPVPRGVLLKAAIFRIEHSKEHLSLVDCVGYMFARELNIKFVTGDQAFKNKDSVEFIK